MEAHITEIDPDEVPRVHIHPAGQAAVDTVLNAGTGGHDGRSPWMWLRLPNGDLFLGVFPQGDTYWAVEQDAVYHGPEDDVLWCEQCGERPQVVHTTNAGLCARCAASTIDEPEDRGKLAVIVEGGVVQAIVSDGPLTGMDVTIIDYDAEGVDAEALTPIDQGGGSTMDALVRTETITKAEVVVP